MEITDVRLACKKLEIRQGKQEIKIASIGSIGCYSIKIEDRC